MKYSVDRSFGCMVGVAIDLAVRQSDPVFSF
jgi:hypothetical protein